MIAGPLALAVGYAILMQRAGQGPDPGWFLSHAILLGGVGLMLPAIAGLGTMLHRHGGRSADIGVALAFVGALALTGQFSIDLAVGQLAVDQAEMMALFQRLSASPMIALPFQSVGPVAFYAGLLVLAFLLRKYHLISWWAGALVAAGVTGVGSGALIGMAPVTWLGFASMCAGFFPIGWKHLAEPRA
jgi:hypothetical protein